MKIKKVIAVAVCITIVCGGIAGGIYGYKSYEDKKLVAEVQPVSYISSGYWGDTESSYGMVTNDSSQEIYLSDSKVVKKVFVKQGDTVKSGDPLLEYDTAEVAIEIERKKLDISTLENKIAIANHALEALKAAKPVKKDPPELDEDLLDQYLKEDELKNNKPQKDVKDKRIYNYIMAGALPYNMKTDPKTGKAMYPAGTEEDPYIYYCNKNAYMTGSFLNSIRPSSAGGDGIVVKFIICKKDSKGKMVMTSSGGDTEEPDTGDTQQPDTGTTETPGTEGTEKPGTGGTEGTEKPGTEGTENTGTESAGISKTAENSRAGAAAGAQQNHTENAAVSRHDITRTAAGHGGKVPMVDTSVTPNTVVLNGNNIPADYSGGEMWYIFTGKDYIPTSKADEFMNEYYEKLADWKEPEGYTQEELDKAIPEKENQLRVLDISKRKLLLELDSLQKTASDGMVYAKVDGYIKTAGDPDEINEDDNSAFLVVTGTDGLYVSGSISELLLDDVAVGTIVTANSWESGMTFEAKITEISDYPVNNNSYGSGNPNVSYYAYTAFIEDSSALKNGEYVDLSISTNQSAADAMFIEKAYVRQEDGKSYVMIADENNRLKKQYVVTGRTIYGSSVEIKSGLSQEDRIAFPYGKNAVEGAAVTDKADTMYN